MAIIGALAKGLAKGGGRAVASNIMGRKKTVKPSAIAPRQGAQGQQQGQRKGSALVKSPTTAITKAMAPIQKVSTGPVAKGDYLAIIHEKVLTIEKIVTGVYKAEKDNLKAEKQAEKDDARKNQEQKLETKDKKPEKKKPSLRQLPKLGVFGWLKRFIGNILMGLFLSKMVDFAGLLPGIVRAIDGITTFLADFGILMVDALTTFADWGIKAYNFTFGAIEKVSGTLFGENADKVVGLIDTALFLTTAIAASMAVESLMGDDGGDFSSRKPGRRGSPGVTQGRGGRGPRPRIPGTGPRVTGGGGGLKIPRFPRLPFGGVVRGLAGPFINTLLAIWDFSSRKSAGQTNVQAGAGTGGGILGGIAGAAIAATLFPEPFSSAAGLITLGILGSLGYALGGAGADKLTGADKVGQYQEGGRVRRKKVRRGIDIRKKKRKKLRLSRPTREIMAPLPTVDEKKLDPDDVGKNNREWWDFLGWAGTGNAEKPLGQGGKILAEKTTRVGNELGKNDYFGPILRVASKLILDQDITSRDYSNIGRGINLLVDDGIVKNKVGTLGYNQGGLAENLPQLDVTDWVSKTFKDTLRDDLKKKYLPNSSYGSTDGPGSTPGARDSATGELQDLMQGPQLGSSTAPNVAENAHAGFKKIYNLAKQAGDPFPEVTAAQWAIESGYGSSKTGKNNPFGQTGTHPKYGGTTLATPRDPGGGSKTFMNFGSELEAVKFRVKRWVPEYGNAKTPYEALMNIQKHGGNMRYAQGFPSAQHPDGDWMGYVRSVSRIMSENGMDPQRTAKFESTSSSSTSTYASPDLSGTEQGELTEASAKLLQDFPQIKSRGSAPQIYASGLGYWLKKNFIPPAKDPHRRGTGDLGDPPQRGADMEHPDHGQVRASHAGTGHKRGVALDLGSNSASLGGPHAGDQKYMWPYISKFLKQYGLNKHSPYFTLHGRSESFSPVGSRGGPDGGHNDHFHVEFHKGGMVGGSGLVNAVLKTGEMVIDVDSTGPAKNLLLAINQASSREGIIKAIRDYAPYDARAEQTVIVPEESEDVPQVLLSGGSSSTTLLPVLMGSSNPFEFLEYQG